MIPSNLGFADVALSLPLETLDSLLKNDPRLISSTGFGGQTALHKAAYVGNHSVALTILKYGADPNTPNDIGETSLHVACSKGSLKLLVILLKYKGDLYIRNKNGYLPIHCAAQSGSLVIIQYLSEVYNFNLETPDANDVTILHSACAGGHLDLVRFLLEVKHVFCLGIDSTGNSVLHSGALGGQSGVCWSIVNHGGESLLTNKNNYGQIPLQVAKSSLTVSQDCLKWLERWTKEYESKKRISSYRLQKIILLILPFLIFHIGLFLAYWFSESHQWKIGVPAFLLLLFVIKRQQHRINHPSRLANPLYLGCYTAGYISSVACYIVSFQFSYSVLIYCVTIVLYTVQLYFMIYIVTRDPGNVPQNTYVRDALQKLSEDRLEDEQYCPQCFVSAPLASHHCRLCGRCVLHLDHHCLFLNACIGANNHWHFVLFVLLNIITMSSFLYASYCYVVEYIKPDSDNWAISILGYCLRKDNWVLLLVACNAASLLWGLRLLKYQYNVIGTHQTTFYRMKCGVPQTKYSIKDKMKNFFTFLFNKKITLKMASHYYKV